MSTIIEWMILDYSPFNYGLFLILSITKEKGVRLDENYDVVSLSSISISYIE